MQWQVRRGWVDHPPVDGSYGRANAERTWSTSDRVSTGRRRCDATQGLACKRRCWDQASASTARLVGESIGRGPSTSKFCSRVLEDSCQYHLFLYRMPILRSYVWDHFDKTDDAINVICKLCRTQLSYNQSTSALISHLENQHRLLNPKKKKRLLQDVPTLNQNSIVTMFKNKLPLTEEQQMELSRLLVRFMATDNQPFTLVLQRHFRRLMHGMNDRYKLPCVSSIKSLMVYEADYVRTLIQEKLREVKYEASACIDIWSSDAQDSYLGVDIHYITENFELEDFTLCVLPFEYPHTAVRIAEALTLVFAQFGLQGKVKSIVTDNCSNMLALKSYFPGVEFMRCSVHTLQLSVKSLFQTNIDILTKCRALVHHFSHSNKENERLIQIQAYTRPDQPAISYIGDMAVRWNSTFKMLKRILELQTSVDFIANSAKEKIKEAKSSLQAVLLSEADYAKIAILVDLLDPLAYASKKLETSQCAAVSYVCPLTKTLLRFYEKPVEDEAMDSIRKEIRKDLHERWGSPSEGHMIASFLDPRFKCLSSIDEPLRETIIARVRSLCMQEREDKPHQEGHAGVASTSTPSGSGTGKRKFAHFMRDDYLSDPETPEEQDEIDLYCGIPRVSASLENFDILAWWKVNQTRFPFLSVLCRKYFCRMPSTASVEGIFSMSGNIVCQTRTRLEADMVNDTLILKKFYSKE